MREVRDLFTLRCGWPLIRVVSEHELYTGGLEVTQSFEDLELRLPAEAERRWRHGRKGLTQVAGVAAQHQFHTIVRP